MTNSATTSTQAATHPLFLADGGEMGRRCRDLDWSKTPLGPPDTWPQALRVAVGICLNSRFPMFVWWGPQLINIYNDAYIPILGKKHPSALGRPAQHSWSEIWDVVGPQADLVMTRGEATWNERVLLVMERNDYSENTYFTWSYSPIRDEHGTIVGLYCACTEDTHRVRAEAERDRLLLQIAEEKTQLTDIFRESPAFMAVLSGPDHVFTLVNDQYTKLVGRNMIGLPVRQALPEVAGQGYFEILDRVYQTGVPYVGRDMRIALQRDPGLPPEKRVVEFVYQPTRGPDGSISGILLHGIDLTEYRRAEDAIRKSEARLGLAIGIAQIGTFEADLQTQEVWLNARGREIYGFGLDEPLTSSMVSAQFHPDDHAMIIENIAAALAPDGAGIFNVEHRIRRRSDNAERWIRGRGLAIRSEESQATVRCVGTYLDITEWKKARDELAQHRDQLDQLVKDRTAELEASHQRLRLAERLASLGTLSAGLGHDMGNLLLPVRVRLDTLDAMSLPPEALEEVKAIRAVAEYLQKLAGGLRLLAVDSTQGVAIEPTELATWWQEAQTVLKNSLPPGVTLSADIPQGCWVKMSRASLAQVAFNLVQNSGHAMRDQRGGTVHVWAKCHEGRVQLGFTDTGPGMTPEVQRRCMEPFFSTKVRGISTGLGLSLVYGFVKEAGGTVELTTELGKGTTFILDLPAGIPDDEGKRKVAVVGITEPRMRSIVEAELRALSYEVRTGARDAQDTCDLLVLDQPDGAAMKSARRVVLLDEPGRVPGAVGVGAKPKMAKLREALRYITPEA